MVCRTTSSLSGSSALVASSRISSRGLLINARAITIAGAGRRTTCHRVHRPRSARPGQQLVDEIPGTGRAQRLLGIGVFQGVAQVTLCRTLSCSSTVSWGT